jgi:hypothetical protein
MSVDGLGHAADVSGSRGCEFKSRQPDQTDPPHPLLVIGLGGRRCRRVGQPRLAALLLVALAGARSATGRNSGPCCSICQPSPPDDTRTFGGWSVLGR